MHFFTASLLESVIHQWDEYLERKSQLDQWLESVDHKVEQPLEPQNGLKEKFSLLDHFQTIVAEVENHSKDLHQLMGKARELYEKTEDDSFREAAQEELKIQFSDIATVVKVNIMYAIPYRWKYINPRDAVLKCCKLFWSSLAASAVDTMLQLGHSSNFHPAESLQHT